MKINLPYVDSIQIVDHLDRKTLKDLVTKSFCLYTRGTSKDYRYVDKLHYIDNLRLYYIDERYSNSERIVKELIHSHIDYQLDYEDNVSTDFIGEIEFCSYCYEMGHLLFSRDWTNGSNSHLSKLIHLYLCEIISIVMNVTEDNVKYWLNNYEKEMKKS